MSTLCCLLPLITHKRIFKFLSCELVSCKVLLQLILYIGFYHFFVFPYQINIVASAPKSYISNWCISALLLLKTPINCAISIPIYGYSLDMPLLLTSPPSSHDTTSWVFALHHVSTHGILLSPDILEQIPYDTCTDNWNVMCVSIHFAQNLLLLWWCGRQAVTIISRRFFAKAFY